MHLVTPQRLACADVIRYLRNEKRFANLRRSREKLRALVQQTVYYRRPAFVHVVKELIQRYSMQIIRVVHLSHLSVLNLSGAKILIPWGVRPMKHPKKQMLSPGMK